MTNAADLASEITRRLPDVKRGSLVVYGDIFGGRIDNIHVVTSATVSGNPQRLVVGFNEGETLEVWDPDHAIVSAHEFRINNASRVRWEWLYYGRPKVADNRYFIEHVRDSGGAVVATTNADWVQRDFKPKVERPPVELIGIFEGANAARWCTSTRMPLSCRRGRHVATFTGICRSPHRATVATIAGIQAGEDKLYLCAIKDV